MDVTGIGRLYLDPSSLGQQDGADPNARVLTDRTRIRVFGERKIPHELPGLYCGTSGRYEENITQEIQRVAIPSEGAKTLQEILRGSARGNKWVMKDLGQLEVVSVPLVRKSDPNKEAADCVCAGQESCNLVPSTLTLFPSSLIEQSAQQPGGGSFTGRGSTGDIRRKIVALQQQARQLIDRFRDIQHDKNPKLACVTSADLAAWTEVNKAMLQDWMSLWAELDSRRAPRSNLAEEIRQMYHAPPPPPEVPTETQAAPPATNGPSTPAAGRGGVQVGRGGANHQRP